MKKIVLFVLTGLSFLHGQFSPSGEDFFGGGIGYSPMYIKLDSIPGASQILKLGLDPTKFDDPFVLHGGEGFAHVTGRWRIGGYAGLGSTNIATVPDILVFEDALTVDSNSDGTPDEGDGVWTESDDGAAVPYEGENRPSIEANFSFSLGATTVEYVLPLLQDLELSAGALMGLGRVGISLDQHSGTPTWEGSFSNAYGTPGIEDAGILYYIVDDKTDYEIIPGQVPGLRRDISATFFDFQPYMAVKWQFLERLGLRISVGFNKGTISAGNWKLNGRKFIGDSPEAAVQGVTFRTMLYIGL